jgi:prepilin-type N-terminal cleavage/methylation domain-containing protein
MRNRRGFTVIELLVTIAMLGMFASIALPSFAGLLGRQQLNQAASQIENAILRGRTLALAKNQAVNLNITLPAAGQSVTYQIVTASNTVLASDTLPSQVAVSISDGAGATLTTGTSQIRFNARGVITAPTITAAAIPTAILTQNQNTRQVRLLSVLGKVKVMTP